MHSTNIYMGRLDHPIEFLFEGWTILIATVPHHQHFRGFNTSHNVADPILSKTNFFPYVYYDFLG